MKIKLHTVSEEGLHLEGEERPGFLNIQEEFYRFEKPVRYSLDIQWAGKKSLLVRGLIETVVRARCVRTLEWFDLPLQVTDFQHHIDHPHGDEVDLTEPVREDILLLLPSYPVLPSAKPIGAEADAPHGGGPLVWNKLDQLKLK